jgi:hypothetical protein
LHRAPVRETSKPSAIQHNLTTKVTVVTSEPKEEHEPKDNQQIDLFDESDAFMNSFFNSESLLKTTLKWKLHLAIVLVVAIALSVVFSSPLFIAPKYKSFAVVYPSNLISYSSETPTEQMLQLFRSEDIKKAVADTFQLAKHYGIDTTNPNYLSLILREYDHNVTVKKTEFESIVIEVYDKDPHTAAKMVHHIIKLMNMKARQLQREKTAEVVTIYKDLLEIKQHQIDSVQERMTFLRKEYNLYDYSIQVKEFTKGQVKSITGGARNNQEIRKVLENIEEHGGEFLFLGGYLASLAASYNEIKMEYDKSLSDLTKELTYTNMVTKPYPADKKSYPVRWLIVLVTTLSSLIIAIIIISFIDRHRAQKREAEPIVQQ